MLHAHVWHYLWQPPSRYIERCLTVYQAGPAGQRWVSTSSEVVCDCPEVVFRTVPQVHLVIDAGSTATLVTTANLFHSQTPADAELMQARRSGCLLLRTTMAVIHIDSLL